MSLEPTSIEGIFNTITTVGAMTEAEDAAIDLVEIAARAARRRRGAGPGAARRRAATRRASSASSGSTRRSRRATGCPSRSGGPAAGTCSAPTASRRARRPGTRSREVDPEMLLLMPCGFHLAETVARMGTDAAAAGLRGARRGPPRPGLRPRRIGLLQPARPAGHRRHRAAGRDLRPGRRSWTSPRPGPGRRSRPDGRATACRSASTLRLPVVRRGRTPAAGPDDLEGWAQLCPDCVGKAGDNGFLRFRLRQALTERRGRGRPATADAPAATPPDRRRRAAGRRRRSRRRDARLLRGPRPRVRRLVPAPRPLRARPDPRRRLERRARRRRALARRRCRSAARSSSSPPGPAGGRRCSPARASCRCTTRASAPLDRARERLVAHGLRAHLHVRDAWAEPGPPGRRRLHRLLAEPRPARPAGRRSSASSGAGCKPGGTFAFIDSLLDPQSSAADHPTPADDVSVRRLDDGREFTIVKVYYEPAELEARAARAAGFDDVVGDDDRPLLPAGVARRRGADAG